MIRSDELVQGQHYFFVLYYDENGTIPMIRTFIYIGKNIFGGHDKGESEDEWYFQDPDSYLQYGSLVSLSKAVIEKVNPTFDALDEGSLHAVYDLNGLIHELSNK